MMKRFTYNLNGCTLQRLLVFVAITLVLYNEFGCFVFNSWLWPLLSSPLRSNKELHVLFVADPQLVGLQDEPPLFGYITRWDSDKYLRLGFWHAVGHVRPDIVIFLGDLFDEGSSGSDEDYQTYVQRFLSVFKLPAHVQTIYISGDNDVGGEGFDAKEHWKVERFKKHFDLFNSTDITTAKFVDILKLSVDWGETVSQSVINQWTAISHKFSARYRIICNHMTLLDRHGTNYVELLNVMKPHIIVTAHTHLAKMYRCNNCRSLSTGQYQPAGEVIDLAHSGVLILDLNATQLYELTIPTCSYRMGVPNMGFGAAVIGDNGRMKFTILWLPSRYKILGVYALFFTVAFILISIKYARRRCNLLIGNQRNICACLRYFLK